MKRLLWLVAAALLLAPPTWAADGDACDSDTGKVTRGTWKSVSCVMVCDGIAAGETTCTEHDFNNGGMPDLIVFELEMNSGELCSGTPDVTVTTGPVTGGTPSYNIDTSAVTLNPTTSRVVVVTKDAHLDRYLFFAVADVADCVDGDVDVRMHLSDRVPGAR